MRPGALDDTVALVQCQMACYREIFEIAFVEVKRGESRQPVHVAVSRN